MPSSSRSVTPILIAICGLLISSVGLAQDTPPEWLKITKAIQARREKFHSISYTLMSLMTAPEALSHRSDFSPANPGPSMTIEATQQIRVDLLGGRFRHRILAPLYDGQRRQSYAREGVIVVDGKDAYSYYPYHDNFILGTKRRLDLVKENINSSLFDRVADGPIAWSLGIFQPSDFRDKRITNLPELGFKLHEAGNEITATGILQGYEVTYVFDAAKGYCATRAIFDSRLGFNGKSDHSFLIGCSEMDGEWYPSVWKSMWKPPITDTVSVRDFRIHDEFEDAVFQVPADFLQPGIVYCDMPARKTYMIGENGELIPQQQ